MENHTITSKKTIGIIGAGKRGSQLFQLFSNSSFSRVVYIADVNPLAPGLDAARKAGVPAYSDLSEALLVPADFIFEVTGLDEVVRTLAAHIDPTNTRLITHDMSAIILNVIDENDQNVREAGIAEIKGIKAEIERHLQRLEQLVMDIRDIMDEMNILSINARIEAARAGEHGKGFEVVASQMGQSSASVEKITREIAEINQAIGKTSGQIDDSLKRLA